MKVVTAEEMRVIDRRTIEGYGIPGAVLMERAGLAVVSRIKEVFGRRRVIAIVGSGNNGGDGLVIARNLYSEGWDVKVFLTTKPENIKGDALLQYKVAAKFGVKIYPMHEFLTYYPSLITRDSLLVDALLGTGISKNVTGVLSEVIHLLNRLNIEIISVDIPSGISSDDGQVMGVAVRADYTVTFGLPKRGHFLYPGAQYTGKLFIEDIGFPQELLKSDKLNVELLMKHKVSPFIPERRRYSHKGDYGHVLLVAGSKGKTGAALMAAKACLRSGTGLVTIGVPKSLADIFQSRVTEEMTLVLPDKGDGTLSERASRVILIETLVKNSTRPMVIDADGINSLKGGREVFSKSKVPIILTPHPGEMARLLGKQRGLTVSSQDIEKDRINIALSFAKQTGTYIVLKGVPTIIAEPEGKAYINPTGNPGMASAGTGDVLTGMISGFLSQGLKPIQAAILGVFLHGFAGDIVASEKGEYPLIASDIIDKIPAAFHSLGHG
jgi:NAD(P)H-hydrate epimerase